MSYADFRFATNCNRILTEGISDEGFNVRPKWEDGTPAHTKKILYAVDHYRLTKDSIPIMTLRRTAFKSAIDEILWIYQKNSNKISELNSHVWDSWDVGDGTIGKAYGYQIGQRYKHHKYQHGEDLSQYPSAEVSDGYVWLSQIDAVIWDLKNNPGSRSIMTNMYNHDDLHAMGLRPCAYSMTFNVTKDSDGEMVLNGMLNQRSQDMLTANNWNVVQYSVLLQMIAQVVGMKVGRFTHVVADMHIYDRHEEWVKELIASYNDLKHQYRKDHPRKPIEDAESEAEYYQKMMNDTPYPNPTFWINPEVKNFYDFTVKDFALDNYQYLPFDHKIPVAV
jgi:thymidylate synthase